MAKIDEIHERPASRPEDVRRQLELIIRKMNEIITALNTLLP